ncbi:phosphotransferase [Fluoribacter dumoffii]|uniref:Homoserine kinase n=1 Tax=Fluoribacter dumoffii TaxID=463 RepID=A0A377GB62_9GAMM|nr:phosphotransferase [Fluoribacter dumoffii]KTC88772.1 putative aminoglycoside phosphotransferase [Fluoribacter dumoffii NY 23]STO21740.1 homoserine kinase [Fluoribacter dumoffii]
MLNANEVKQLESNYDIQIIPQEIYSVSGGDINSTYLIKTSSGQYIVKRIALDEYVREYKTTIEDVKKSLCFSEQISKAQLAFGNAITAIEGEKGVLLETGPGVLMLYPYVEGTICEDQQISLNMVRSISRRLKTLHHATISYDHEFSSKKFAIYIDIVNQLVSHPGWNYLKLLTIFPRLKTVISFMRDNRELLKKSIRHISKESVCHNDLKPKNILWTKDTKDYWIIDWEAAADFDHRTDYLDTLVAWCIEKKDSGLLLNPEKVTAFQEEYYIPKEELTHATNITILKWYFWLYFCISKCFKKPKEFSHYLYHANYSIHYIEFLIHQELNFLEK